METLDYNSLYQIIKYQYDKIKKARDGGMTEEELARRAMYDKSLDFVNNPSFMGLGELTSNMILPTPPEREPEDPSRYIYNSRDW
jgi:hypothetical protein